MKLAHCRDDGVTSEVRLVSLLHPHGARAFDRTVRGVGHPFSRQPFEGHDA